MNFIRFQQGLRLGMSPEVADQMTRVYKGSSSTTQSTSSNSTSTPYQQEDFQNLLNGANSWLSSGGFDSLYNGGNSSVAGLTDQQQAGLSGSYNTAANTQALYDTSGQSTLAKYLGSYDPNSTGLTSAIDASNNALDWNYNTQVAPTIRQGATDAGQYGSTRHGVAEGIAQSQLSQQKTNAASTLAYQDQQNFNNNQTQVLNNLSTITKGLNSGNGLAYDAGTLQQTQDQNQINGDLQAWAYQNNVSLNDLLAYQQLISGNMGGTSTGNSTTTSTGTSGSSALGSLATIGGAAVGSYFGVPTVGATVGTAVGNGLS